MSTVTEGQARCTGCKRLAFLIDCFFPREEGPAICFARYCSDCCQKNGFCRVCGEFWGGIESFEFRHPGICDDCDEQWKTELGEYDEDWVDHPSDWEEV